MKQPVTTRMIITQDTAIPRYIRISVSICMLLSVPPARNTFGGVDWGSVEDAISFLEFVVVDMRCTKGFVTFIGLKDVLL